LVGGDLDNYLQKVRLARPLLRQIRGGGIENPKRKKVESG